MKNLMLLLTFVFVLGGVIAQQDRKSPKQIKLEKLDKQIAASNDGTPDYKLSVLESIRSVFGNSQLIILNSF